MSSEYTKARWAVLLACLMAGTTAQASRISSLSHASGSSLLESSAGESKQGHGNDNPFEESTPSQQGDGHDAQDETDAFNAGGQGNHPSMSNGHSHGPGSQDNEDEADNNDSSPEAHDSGSTGNNPGGSFTGTTAGPGSSVVPLPAALWLFPSGLAGMMTAAYRRRQR